MKKLLLIILLPLLINASCKKTVTPIPTPTIEQLPPATQEGKNTCGFLVNGKVWLPKAKRGDLKPSLVWWYDPAYHNGTFNINGLRIEKGTDSTFTDFVIAIDNFSQIGKYLLNKEPGRMAEYGDWYKNCLYYKSDTIPGHNSFVNITTFNLQTRIIAGTFQFTLAKPGCDTIRITEGRFDIKL